MSAKKKQRPNRRKPPGKKPPLPATKIGNWTTPTVLGLILSVLGAISVVELRPQLAMNPLAELATNEPFSAPFEISNSGYLDLHVDNVIVIFHQVEYGSVKFIDEKSGNRDWDNFDLISGGGGAKTISANFANGVPAKADIVFAVDYRFWGIKLSRKYFRFVGFHRDSWQWTKQPMNGLDLNAAVEDALVKHARGHIPN